MSQKREFAPVPDFIQQMAEKSPGGAAVVNKTSNNVTPATNGVSQTPVVQPPAQTHELQPARPMFRVKPSTEKMSVNVPKDLYEELREFMKLTDVPMSEVIVEGTRRELARRKKEGF